MKSPQSLSPAGAGAGPELEAEPLLAAAALTAVRGERVLFRDVRLTLGAGELLHVHGPNGSGKTTLLRILCGLTLPTEGEVRWRGEEIRRSDADYCAEIVYVGHADGIKLELSALENLRFARALAVAPTDAALEAILERFQLAELADTPARALSAGQRRRVALGRLLTTRATLWLLDEPFASLDKTGVGALEALLGEHLAAGGMAILASHQLHRIPGPAAKELHLFP